MTDPNLDQINQDTALVVAQLRSGAVITTDEQYVAIGQLFRAGKDREKAIKEYFKPLKDAANKAHKTITAAENDALAPLVNPMTDLKAALEKYDTDKKRAAAQEAARLESLRQEELARKAEALKAAQPDLSPLEEAMAMEEIEAAIPVPVALPVAAAPKISGVVHRTVIDREKVQARIDAAGFDHGIPGIAVRCAWEFTVNSLADVPEEYKKRQ
jgi:hypothetical protein